MRALEDLDIAYMVTGSLASTHHGHPRSTHDVGIVIAASPEAMARLVSRLVEAGFYLDGDVATEALRRRGQFNAIEMQTAVKIDLIVRKDRAFSAEELGRRRSVALAEGIRVALATPEDTILAKLEWARKGGGSEKQLADVAGRG